jgi:hypothetical protein
MLHAPIRRNVEDTLTTALLTGGGIGMQPRCARLCPIVARARAI